MNFWILVTVVANLAGGIAWSVVSMRRQYRKRYEDLLAGMPEFIEKKRKERGE